MDVDMLIYLAGSVLMVFVSIALVIWGWKTGQFEENEHLKRKPLEDDEED